MTIDIDELLRWAAEEVGWKPSSPISWPSGPIGWRDIEGYRRTFRDLTGWPGLGYAVKAIEKRGWYWKADSTIEPRFMVYVPAEGETYVRVGQQPRLPDAVKPVDDGDWGIAAWLALREAMGGAK